MSKASKRKERSSKALGHARNRQNAANRHPVAQEVLREVWGDRKSASPEGAKFCVQLVRVMTTASTPEAMRKLCRVGRLVWERQSGIPMRDVMSLGLSRDGVSDALEALEDSGLVVRTRRGRGAAAHVSRFFAKDPGTVPPEEAVSEYQAMRQRLARGGKRPRGKR